MPGRDIIEAWIQFFSSVAFVHMSINSLYVTDGITFAMTVDSQVTADAFLSREIEHAYFYFSTTI